MSKQGFKRHKSLDRCKTTSFLETIGFQQKLYRKTQYKGFKRNKFQGMNFKGSGDIREAEIFSSIII
jgi:hypothetical protein